MEGDADDLDNLFEEENEDAPQQVEESTQNESNEANAGTRVVPPKRVVKNPRLKFNPDRLCGERGIPILVDHFKNVKFKGKGHEVEDLDKLLASLEHWTHRLFPSMKFQDCLRQIEHLGKKRPVQTCLRKIRMDMPILNSDFVGGDDEKDDVQRNDDISSADPFDRLVAESQEIVEPVVSSPLPNESSGHVLGSSFGFSLTEEQRKRMEYNRMLAAERRKAKVAAAESSYSDSLNLGGDNAPFDILNASVTSCGQNSEELFDVFSKDRNSTLFRSNATISNDNSIPTDSVLEGSRNKISEDSQGKSFENLKIDELIDLVNEDESSQIPKSPAQNSSFNSVEQTELFELLQSETSSEKVDNVNTLKHDSTKHAEILAFETNANFEELEKDSGKSSENCSNLKENYDHMETCNVPLVSNENALHLSSEVHSEPLSLLNGKNQSVEKQHESINYHLNENCETVGIDELMDLVDDEPMPNVSHQECKELNEKFVNNLN